MGSLQSDLILVVHNYWFVTPWTKLYHYITLFEDSALNKISRSWKWWNISVIFCTTFAQSNYNSCNFIINKSFKVSVYLYFESSYWTNILWCVIQLNCTKFWLPLFLWHSSPHIYSRFWHMEPKMVTLHSNLGGGGFSVRNCYTGA